MSFENEEQVGPDFMCDTNGVGGDNVEDKLILIAHTHREKPIIAVQVTGDYETLETWLDRTQVQDLMVVLAYWLQETEEEAE